MMPYLEGMKKFIDARPVAAGEEFYGWQNALAAWQLYAANSPQPSEEWIKERMTEGRTVVQARSIWSADYANAMLLEQMTRLEAQGHSMIQQNQKR